MVWTLSTWKYLLFPSFSKIGTFVEYFITSEGGQSHPVVAKVTPCTKIWWHCTANQKNKKIQITKRQTKKTHIRWRHTSTRPSCCFLVHWVDKITPKVPESYKISGVTLATLKTSIRPFMVVGKCMWPLTFLDMSKIKPFKPFFEKFDNLTPLFFEDIEKFLACGIVVNP